MSVVTSKTRWRHHAQRHTNEPFVKSLQSLESPIMAAQMNPSLPNLGKKRSPGIENRKQVLKSPSLSPKTLRHSKTRPPDSSKDLARIHSLHREKHLSVVSAGTKRKRLFDVVCMHGQRIFFKKSSYKSSSIFESTSFGWTP